MNYGFSNLRSVLPSSLVLFACLLGAALFQQEGYAAGLVVGPNINLSQAAGNQYETSVAINPLDNTQIFVVGRNEVGGLSTARSSDGGLTWTKQLIAQHAVPPVAGDLPRAYGNASVAWDALGNLFITYLFQGSSSSVPIVALAVSKDGGATFYAPSGSGPAILLPNNTLSGDQPTVAVGPGSGGYSGSVWVTYFSFGGIWVSGAGVSSTGAVGSFTSQPLPSQPVGVNFGDIAVGPNGEVIVTYGPNAVPSAIYTNVDPDGLGSAPFSAFSTVHSVNVGGFTGIPAQPNWGIDPEAGVAYDRSNGSHRGRVYLVYTDKPSLDPTDNDTNIFVVYSDNQGTSWSTPVRVNDDIGGNSQFLPHISLDQSSGAIAVTWYDARNSAANNTAQYFGAISTDAGATFGPNFQLSAGTSNQANSVAAIKKADYGDYTGNAFVNGKLVPAWADNSNSTGDNPDGATDFDIYTAVVQVPFVDTTPPEITATANPATLWPPNGKMMTVTVSGTMSDSGSGVNPSTAAFVVSDEYGSIQPAGPITVGGDGTYSFTVLLEARCDGSDVNGRVYSIAVVARDSVGNKGRTVVTVTVPHDQGI